MTFLIASKSVHAGDGWTVMIQWDSLQLKGPKTYQKYIKRLLMKGQPLRISTLPIMISQPKRFWTERSCKEVIPKT